MFSESQRKQITSEIFETTGLKVDAEDPAVVAALFYSSKLRSALDEGLDQLISKFDVQIQHTQKSIDAAVHASLIAFAADSKSLQNENQKLYEKMIEQAKQSARSELPNLKSELLAYSKKLTSSISSTSVSKPSINTVSLIGGAVLIAIASGIFGAAWFGNTVSPMNSDDVQKLAMGRAIAKTIPLLDKPTKEKLTKLLEENAGKKSNP